jgi:hypothetical protein
MFENLATKDAVTFNEQGDDNLKDKINILLLLLK